MVVLIIVLYLAIVAFNIYSFIRYDLRVWGYVTVGEIIIYVIMGSFGPMTLPLALIIWLSEIFKTSLSKRVFER